MAVRGLWVELTSEYADENLKQEVTDLPQPLPSRKEGLSWRGGQGEARHQLRLVVSRKGNVNPQTLPLPCGRAANSQVRVLGVSC